MEKIIREILVLPLKLLLLIGKIFPIVDRYSLVKWIWQIGRITEDGCSYIFLTVEKFGLPAGRNLAHEILKQTRSGMVVFTIAQCEKLEKNYDAAKEWIDLAEGMDCKDQYHLLSLKLGMTHKIPEYDHAEIVDEILACNYLPMEYTHQALINKAFLYFKEGRLEKAEEILDHIMRIKNDQTAEYLKAVICLVRNEDAIANKFLAKSCKRMSENDYSAHVAQAYYTANRVTESMQHLYNAVKSGYNVEDAYPGLKNILESPEFAEYCAARN